MFVCTKCGICCKNIDKVPELDDFHFGDGVCMHLTEDNLCNIYENRPDVCNVERMYQLKYKSVMSQREYDELNSAGCKLLQQL